MDVASLLPFVLWWIVSYVSSLKGKKLLYLYMYMDIQRHSIVRSKLLLYIQYVLSMFSLNH